MTVRNGHLVACAEAEVKAQARRLIDGTDPDEHTIYNVLCPEIRATWKPYEERERRVQRCGHVEIHSASARMDHMVNHMSQVE